MLLQKEIRKIHRISSIKYAAHDPLLIFLQSVSLLGGYFTTSVSVILENLRVLCCNFVEYGSSNIHGHTTAGIQSQKKYAS